jgi:hypothetical protein
MKYCCHIREVTDHEIIVEADSEAQAEQIALAEHLQGGSAFNAVTERETTATLADPQ